ncbi:hypothetical protein EYF80_056366 [Liparis tanakae]|uniref:Uncharacterized protein n=1 Tax=Liparis tanakae TaxID=230148 RepID=A0A4Z2EXB9_9TELE|nr:hypothetical protein EYF80_056366 [Liparis tanakae]
MYDDTVRAPDEASKPDYEHHNKTHNIRPGGHEYRAEAREASKSAAIRETQTGPELEYQKLTNARYKYALRFICKR